MGPFVSNGDVWGPVLADRDGPRPIDGTGTPGPATTGPSAMRAHLPNRPHGPSLEAVSAHGAGHRAMHGHGLPKSPHAVIPEDAWADVGEWACDHPAARGREAIHAADTAPGCNVPAME